MATDKQENDSTKRLTIITEAERNYKTTKLRCISQKNTATYIQIMSDK